MVPVILSLLARVRVRVMSEAEDNGAGIMVNAVRARVGGGDCGGDAGQLRLILVMVESVVMVVVIFMAQRGCLREGQRAGRGQDRRDGVAGSKGNNLCRMSHKLQIWASSPGKISSLSLFPSLSYILFPLHPVLYPFRLFPSCLLLPLPLTAPSPFSPFLFSFLPELGFFLFPPFSLLVFPPFFPSFSL